MNKLRSMHWLVLGLVVGLSMPSIMTVQAQADDEVDVPAFSGRPPDEHPILAPCTRFEDRYNALGFQNANVEEWPDHYHAEVEKVINEYLAPLELSCDAQSYGELLRPGTELSTLARKMPTWQDPNVPLSRFDMGRVLLEHLRIYECALIEYRNFLYYDTTNEEFDKEEEIQGRFLDFFDFFLSDLLRASSERAQIINRERAIARKTLNRVLTIISTAERMRPLEAEFECMQRFSLDMRNIASLTAEASSCIPRAWNAKDILRDYNEE